MQFSTLKTVIGTFLHFIQEEVFNRKNIVAQRLISLPAMVWEYIYCVKQPKS